MAKKRLVVAAGPHPRHDVPMRLKVGRCQKARLVDEATGRPVPCQIAHGELLWVLDRLAAGETKSYILETGRGSAANAVAVRAERAADKVEFFIRELPFMTYNFGKQWARPFFYPVIGPDFVQLTRSYPMIEDVPGETTDHPHHKSFWVAHGDVGGVDNWSEEKGHGRIVSKRLKEVTSGAVAAIVCQDLEWVSRRGASVVSEEREIRVYAAPPDQRIVDLRVTFKAKSRKVVFGDTKEGGICSVRVATPMVGSRGGKIENSYGAIGEAECWGRRAVWCDYSGTVNAKPVGIAIFDTPGNLRHPTYWHVRDYGLMTANPFGISHFQPDSGERGDWTLPPRKELTFRYRIYMHRGDATIGRVRDKYHDYVNPPTVRVER